MNAAKDTAGSGRQEPQPERELRVALAMRGGVSLAVWIGGALAELDLVRRAMADDPVLANPSGDKELLGTADRAARYAALLRAHGYTSIRFDVLAGASAGGLNSVVYGFAQAIGTDLEWLRDVWEERGDIWELFHPAWTLREPFRTEAVLSADRKFYAPLLEAVVAEGRRASGAADRSARLRSDYLTIDLSATVQSGPPLPDLRTDADLRPRTAHFRFRHDQDAPTGRPDDLPRTIPADDPLPPDVEEQVRRLAYAARATSSFPGAFEPAAIFSWGGGVAGRTRANDGDPGCVDDLPGNMAGVFSEVTTSPEVQFDVMDGGVFDNIPISRAVHAIADAPAGLPTTRILIYLDPTPPRARTPQPPTAIRDGERRVFRARFLKSVLKAVAFKVATESSTSDLFELETLRTLRREQRSRIAQFAARELPPILASPSGRQSIGDATEVAAEDAYRRFRAESDAQRLSALLVAPGWGFLHTAVPCPPIDAALSIEDGVAVREELAHRLVARADPTKDNPYDPMVDATALIEAIGLIIFHIRELQWPTGSAPDPLPPQRAEQLATAKGLLYRIRGEAQHLRDSRDADVVSSVLAPAAPAPTAQAAAGAGTPDPSEAKRLWVRAQAQTLAARLWPAATDVDAIWEALAGIVRGLWPQSGTEADVDQQVRRLQGLAARAGVEVGTSADSAVPDFFVIGGDDETLQPTPEVGEFAETLRLNRMAADPAHASPWPRGTIGAEAKLAGSSLANFGGFLSAEARNHDWAWGRADAAAGLIRILDELADDVTPPSGAPVRTQIDASRTGPTTKTESETSQPEAAESGQAEARTAAQAAARGLYGGLDRVPPRPSGLSAGRAYGIGARLGLGLQRAWWPSTPRTHRAISEQPSGPARWLLMLLLAALRPVVVLVPLVLRPAALVAVLLTAAVASHLASGTESTAPSLNALRFVAWIALALALIGLSSRVGRLRAWKRVAEREMPSTILEGARKRATRSVVLGAVVTVVVAIAAAGLVPTGTVEPLVSISARLAWLSALMQEATWFDVLLALLLIGVLGMLAGRARASVVKATVDWPGWGFAVVAVAVPFAALPFAGEYRAAAAYAWSAAVVVWFVHHTWARLRWQVVASLGTGAATLAAALLVRAGPAEAPATPPDGLLAEWWSSLWPWVVAPLGSMGGAVLLVWFLRRALTTGESTGEAQLAAWRLGVFLVPVIAWGVLVAFLLGAAWSWFGQVPAGLAAGLFASALTTLVMPFRDAEDVPAK